MRLFGPLYLRTMAWARHPRAPSLLGVLSFAEAVVFPVPPEVMLAPMSLAQPLRAFRFATISLARRRAASSRATPVPKKETRDGMPLATAAWATFAAGSMPMRSSPRPVKFCSR